MKGFIRDDYERNQLKPGRFNSGRGELKVSDTILGEHDAAGNLIFDGASKYTCDAYNRLVMVQQAYKDPSAASGTLQTGSGITKGISTFNQIPGGCGG